MTKLSGLSKQEAYDLLPDNPIFIAYRGSISHGTYVPQDDNAIDDKDIIGVYVEDLPHYIGLGRSEHKEVKIGCWDAVSYEIRKLCRLLMKSNPNVIEMLWVDESKVIYNTVWGRQLRSCRDLFATKAVYHSFTGYAYSQLKKMGAGS